TEHLGPEPREIIPRHRGRDHFDGAAGKTELQRPDGIAPAPVVKLFEFGREDALLAEFASEPFVDHCSSLGFRKTSRLKKPLTHAQARPSASRRRNTIIPQNAPGDRSR